MKRPLEEGLLGRLLHSPDYNLFPNSVVFESNFVQVTKKGKWVDITNLPTIVTMGVTSSDPCLPLPNVLLMARHRPLARDLLGDDQGRSSAAASSIDLTRLLPLRSVRLSIHNAAQRILCLQMVTRKVYYLQLHQDHPNAVFALWARLAHLLQKGPPDSRSQHSLVPPSAESHAMMGRTRQKRTGVFSRLSGRERKRGEKGQRKVSFQGLPARNKRTSRGDATCVSSDVQALLSDSRPPPGASNLGLWPCLDGSSHGLLWQREMQQPACQTTHRLRETWVEAKE